MVGSPSTCLVGCSSSKDETQGMKKNMKGSGEPAGDEEEREEEHLGGFSSMKNPSKMKKNMKGGDESFLTAPCCEVQPYNVWETVTLP
ncbi:unnamed protein product [Linum trigynum]|uniref:Uncharacterized protein n=1 Tax=Linum trigynum TaxID=586398 RepID=A0AAV2GHL6_9ROSI